MLLLCSPSNPTGVVYSAAELTALADIAIETGPANLVASLQTPKGLVQLQSLGI